MSKPTGLVAYVLERSLNMGPFVFIYGLLVALLVLPTFIWTGIVSPELLGYAVVAYGGLVLIYSKYISQYMEPEDLLPDNVEEDESALTWGAIPTLILGIIYCNIVTTLAVLLTYTLVTTGSTLLSLLAFGLLPIVPMIDFEIAQRKGKSIGTFAVWIALNIFHIVGIQEDMTTENFILGLTPRVLRERSSNSLSPQ